MKRGNPLNKNIMKNKNGNPVPSLDDVYKYLELNKDYDKKSYGCKIHKKKTIMLNSLYLMLNKIKENGVETNKEQPKCDCEFNGDYLDARCIHCGKSMD